MITDKGIETLLGADGDSLDESTYQPLPNGARLSHQRDPTETSLLQRLEKERPRAKRDENDSCEDDSVRNAPPAAA